MSANPAPHFRTSSSLPLDKPPRNRASLVLMSVTEAFLELQEQRVPLSSSPFKMGRSSKCALPLEDKEVSREHAMLVWDDAKGCWLLSDLGSTNGTFLNGVRIGGVCPVASGDRIRVGKHEFVVRAPRAEVDDVSDRSSLSEDTFLASEESERWLMLADVRDSTQLIQKLPEGELPRRIRRWIEECRPIVEATNGVINEYVGDGFVVFWRSDRTNAESMLRVMNELEQLETRSGLDFRTVFHFGKVHSGIAVSSGLEKLAGVAVNFLFKCEKAVRGVETRVVVSRAVVEVCAHERAFRSAIRKPVDGFGGEFEFYTLSDGC